MNLNETAAKELLDNQGINYRERNGELVLACLFNDCDADSRPNEAHLYVNAETGQYQCKKCGETGNLNTLANHLGVENLTKPNTPRKTEAKLTLDMVAEAHAKLPAPLRLWLNERGITDECIEDYQLGFGNYYGREWLTIPVFGADNSPLFFKLRKLPHDTENVNRYMFWPKGSTAVPYNAQNIDVDESLLFICEGELDCIINNFHQGIPTLTSTAGAATFNPEWLRNYRELNTVYLAFDRDEAGDKGAAALTEKLAATYPSLAVYKVTLPPELPEGGDLTDFHRARGTNPDELIALAQQITGPKPIDFGKLQPMSAQDVIDVLGLTIKQDEENKLVTFLCQLSAYTEDSQLNLSFNAPSSSGKSFIPIEVARLFPQEDVLELGYVSPTSFFHSTSTFNKETEEYLVDLSRKIIVFLDQPHTMLLEHLRPLLSHDKKEIRVQITDKQQKNGLRAKKIILRGYPSVIFCSAGLRFDEQEATRFLLLSPEISQEKLRAGIIESLHRGVDPEAYNRELNADPQRALLKDRILGIKRAGITDIRIDDEAIIQQHFFAKTKILKPRHQRDIKRLVALVKIFALLNLWWRKREGSIITAEIGDIKEAFAIWDKISLTQELNIPPYVYRLYVDVILAVFNDKNGNRSEDFIGITGTLGVTRQEIMAKHYEIYGRMLDALVLRQQILPTLNQAGLINEERDPSDKRNKLIYPLLTLENSELGGGVKEGPL